MPRVIFKCPYIKGGAQNSAAHLSNYVRYMATREGAQRIDPGKAQLPATKKQRDMVAQLLRDFPLSRGMFEYEDYLTTPTCGNASEFITRALEDNYDQTAKRENYVSYIASRPRAQHTGAHALFTGSDDTLVLSQIADAVAHHPGNVWLPIISLRREDAARLGYDDAKQWRTFLTGYAMQMAEAMKIPWKQFRWYAAFHDEAHHPHVHMVCYSADGKSGYLTKDGIAQIKSGLAKEIFRQELYELYERQTQRRDALTQEAGAVMEELIHQMRTGTLENPRMEQLMEHLSRQLKNLSGKKQYGYLKAPLKSVVDEIVDELAKDPRVASAYTLWYELREEVLRTYKDDLPERLPLSRQKEFKRIKNLVIEEALRLNTLGSVFSPDDTPAAQEQTPEDAAGSDDLPTEELPPMEDTTESIPPTIVWSSCYQQARRYLFGGDGCPQDFAQAFDLLMEEARTGNALATHDLGRMYADGLGRERNGTLAQEWYAKALDAFLTLENLKPNRYVEYRIGKIYASGLGIGQDHTAAAEWFAKSAEQNYKYAQYSLASLYYRGQGVEQDCERAHQLYTKSAEQGFPYAAYELGKMYRDGVGCARSHERSAEYFSTAFLGFQSLERQSHDDKLQYRIGWMFLHGVGVEKNEAAARRWFESSAKLGNTNAQYQLAKIILADPSSEPEQITAALEWLIHAAEDGQDSAQYALGKLYRDGGAGVEQDLEKAALWLEKAAQQDNAHAAYALGKLLLRGEGVHKDTPAAIRWLTAAGHDSSLAQYTLAGIYLAGEDVPKDAPKALDLLRQSASQGNPFAQYRLGKLLLQGEDAPKDVAGAVRQLTLSAEQGNQYAQYTLGKLYLLGKEIPQDKDAAFRWFALAAAQGNEYAQYFLDHKDDFRGPSTFACATQLLHHLGRIFQERTQKAPVRGIAMTDRKLRQRIREKKMAMGHKADDHEEQIQQLS